MENILNLETYNKYLNLIKRRSSIENDYPNTKIFFGSYIDDKINSLCKIQALFISDNNII